jgi:hypothetical protein
VGYELRPELDRAPERYREFGVLPERRRRVDGHDERFDARVLRLQDDPLGYLAPLEEVELLP